MITITFIVAGGDRLYTITTPNRETAWVMAEALAMAGCKARVWRANRLIG